MFTQISQAPLAHCLLKHAKFEIFILKKSRSMSSLMGIKVPTRRKNRLAKKDYTTVVSVLAKRRTDNYRFGEFSFLSPISRKALQEMDPGNLFISVK